jgi:predicted ATPase
VAQLAEGGRHVERLAHHALRGELCEQAITYCRQAGSRAMARSAVQEAVGHLEQALSALEHLPTTVESVASSIDVRFDLRTALWSILEDERANEYVRQAEALAEAAGDRRRLGWVSADRAHDCRNVVNHQQAVDAGEQAIAIAAELGDLRLRVNATDTVAGPYQEVARFARAIELLRANLAALHGALAGDGRRSTAPRLHVALDLLDGRRIRSDRASHRCRVDCCPCNRAGPQSPRAGL